MSEQLKDTSLKPVSKEELELEKLRQDIRFSRRSFMLQLANFITLIGIALGVFYFFQRPQIHSMETARVATEKHQVAQLVIAAHSISSDAERSRMLEMLAEQYPHFVFVSKIARSARAVIEVSARDANRQPSGRVEPMRETTARVGQFHAVPLTSGGVVGIHPNAVIDSTRELQKELMIEQSNGGATPSDRATIDALRLAYSVAVSRLQASEDRVNEQPVKRAAVPKRPAPMLQPRYDWLPNETKPKADAAPVNLPPVVGLE